MSTHNWKFVCVFLLFQTNSEQFEVNKTNTATPPWRERRIKMLILLVRLLRKMSIEYRFRFKRFIWLLLRAVYLECDRNACSCCWFRRFHRKRYTASVVDVQEMICYTSRARELGHERQDVGQTNVPIRLCFFFLRSCFLTELIFLLFSVRSWSAVNLSIQSRCIFYFIVKM